MKEIASLKRIIIIAIFMCSCNVSKKSVININKNFIIRVDTGLTSTDSTFRLQITNKSNRECFIATNNPYEVISNDTMYVEPEYIRRRLKDPSIVMEYEYWPPHLQILNVDSTINIKISYSEKMDKIPDNISVKLFKKQYPYNDLTNHEKYHSHENFRSFAHKNSFIINRKFEIVKK